MRRSLACILFAALITFWPSQRVEAQTAKEIVEKAIAAHGGLDNLKKYPGVKMTAKGKMDVLGMEVDAEGETLAITPDQFKITMKAMLLGQKIEQVQVFNAGKMKVTVNGAAVPLTDEMKRELKNTAAFNLASEIYPLLDDKRFDLSVIDKPAKEGDKEVVGIMAKTKDNLEIRLYFDAKTYNLVKTERKALDFMQKEVKEEMLFLDPKKVDGILRPTKMEILNDGKKIGTFEISEIKHLEKADKKEFDISD